MRYDAASEKYVPVSWHEAFEPAGRHFRGLDDPNQAAFYTSGRLRNEGKFLYQVFSREFGINNLPDRSNSVSRASG
jgi:anaerobic selenocysteine-containing dehydrogenase